jgi:hypothetical protein
MKKEYIRRRPAALRRELWGTKLHQTITRTIQMSLYAHWGPAEWREWNQDDRTFAAENIAMNVLWAIDRYERKHK